MLSFRLDWVQVLGLLVSIILPILVALVTNWKTQATLKAVLLALLAAVTGFGTEVLKALTDHTAYDVGQGLLSALAAFIIAVAMYLGLWKPTRITSSGNGLLSGNKDGSLTQRTANPYRAGAGGTEPLASKDDAPPHA